MQLTVLGMHRSGTSAVTRLLNMMGAYVGDADELWGANPENPKGFWERRDVERLNQEILEAAGADWFRVRRFSIETLSDAQRETFRESARAIVQKLEPHRPWVMKDPRLCLLMSLWRDVLDAPVCVCVYRNPLEVADSLRTRNGFSRMFGLALWEAYVVASLQVSEGLPRVFVSYNRLLADPIRELARLRAELESIGVSGLTAPTAEEVSGFLDKGDYRERETVESFTESASGRQMRLFRALEAGTVDVPVVLSSGAIETLELQEALFAQEANLKAAEEALRARTGEVERHGEAIGALQSEVEGLRNRCAELESETKRHRALEVELEARLNQSREELVRAETERAALVADIESVRTAHERLQAEYAAHQAEYENVYRLVQEQRAALARMEIEARERAELESLRRGNEVLRTEFFALYKILADNRRDGVRLVGWIEALDRDVTGILIARRWKVGRVFAPLGSRLADAATAQQKQAGDAAGAWNSKQLPVYDKVFRSVPDKASLMGSDDAPAVRKATELLARHVPRLRAAAQTSTREVRSLSQHAERLADAAAHLLNSASWRVGDVVVGGLRRVAGSAKAVHWAPPEVRAIRSELQDVRRRTETRIEDPVLVGESGGADEQTNERRAAVAGSFTIPDGSRAHTVIVPVYNAYDEVRECVERLVRYSGEGTRILLIDDASTDERIWPLLEDSADTHARVEAVRNEVNLGFTRTINRGIELSSGDVVILNSDTEVTPRWLDKLEDAAYSRERVATVTPLTNAGSAFSVPRNNRANALPEFMTPEMANAAVEALSERLRPEAPTGNGFCMYIRRDALEAVGRFDEDAFPRGYGEENDFCLRAGSMGFVHLIDDATFVYHAEGASFLDDKQELIAAGLKTINERYPGYDARIQEWLRHDELAVLRTELESIWNGWSPLPIRSALARDRRPTILHLVHEGTGGTLYHVNDLTAAVWNGYRCLRLETGGRRWRLSAYTGREYEAVDEFDFAGVWRLEQGLDDARADALESILGAYAPDLVHIHHLLGSAPEVIDRCQAHGARVVYSFHDFYAVCPSFNLLDERGAFCGGHCTAGNGTCQVHIDWVRHPRLKHEYVHEWRRDRVAESLAKCDALVSFSKSVRQIVVEHFPDADTERYVVIPHGEDLSDMRPVVEAPGEGPIRVLLLGGLSLAKGIELVERILKINQDRKGPFEFHFVGNVTPGYDPERYGAIMHGPYLRENLPEILAAIRPSFALIASPWSETFCYTLSECWAGGIPVLASNLGTQKERVEKTGGGWLLDPQDAEAWYAELERLSRERDAYAACADRVKRIELRSLDAMKQDYLRLYESTLSDAPVSVPAAAAVR